MGQGIIYQIAWSPDNLLVAVGTSIGIYLFETSTWTELRFIETGAWVHLLAFDPSGEKLLSNGSNGALILWDSATGRALQIIETQSSWIKSAAFSHDGLWLVFISDGLTLRLWEINTGRVTELLDSEQLVSEEYDYPYSTFDSVSVKMDDQFLAIGTRGGRIHLWDLENKRIQGTLVSQCRDILTVIFNPVGDTLLSTCPDSDKSLQLWDAESGELIHTLDSYHIADTNPFSPDGQLLAVINGEGARIQYWDVETGKLARTFEQSLDRDYYMVFFSPNWKNFISVAGLGEFKVWNTDPEQVIIALNGFSDSNEDIALSPNQLVIASASYQRVYLWDITNGHPLQTLAASSRRVERVAYSPDGKLLASIAGTPDNTIWLWNAKTNEILYILKGHTDLIHSIAFSPDSDLLISGGFDETLRLWDTGSGKLLQVFDVHDGPIRQVTFSPGGQTIAANIGFYSCAVEMFDVATGELLRQFGDYSGCGAIAFSPDGLLLVAISSEDRALRVWDTATGDLKYKVSLYEDVSPNQSIGSSLAFDPSGNLLVVGEDEHLRILDAHSGKLLYSVEGHTANITKIVFSSDGVSMFTASQDGTIRIWQVKP
jgi:WD40 repeat protein